MANDAFDLDVQVNKSKGFIEPQAWNSIAACSAAACQGERTSNCHTNKLCVTNFETWCC
ncbi:FDLD family class I lanthipeptide [Paenibacillus polymyxa]|uniref:FDLD family class I lanthipeptide n=1 Tax=Paenibacillus polymyxa TaxID=1406 RepID=UPI002AB4CB3D|nr:FDLD family class I lanthipeptide [Paenibacillus polymyxa]MDY7993134.1 FDLD family class I lanthipeptide [Paenibacillus polymyxa]MDY8119677.1 FDLD family class I lanthipeptide [Paenibacillus polymyxa]